MVKRRKASLPAGRHHFGKLTNLYTICPIPWKNTSIYITVRFLNLNTSHKQTISNKLLCDRLILCLTQWETPPKKDSIPSCQNQNCFQILPNVHWGGQTMIYWFKVLQCLLWLMKVLTYLTVITVLQLKNWWRYRILHVYFMIQRTSRNPAIFLRNPGQSTIISNKIIIIWILNFYYICMYVWACVNVCMYEPVTITIAVMKHHDQK